MVTVGENLRVKLLIYRPRSSLASVYKRNGVSVSVVGAGFPSLFWPSRGGLLFSVSVALVFS